MADAKRWEFESITGRTDRVIGFLIASTIASAMVTVMDVWGTLTVPTWNDLSAPISGNAEAVLAGMIALAGLAGLVLFLVTVVLFCMWMHRAAGNIRALGETRAGISPGWAVGWWFIPIANFFMPYKAMREIYQSSDSAASGVDYPLDTAPPLLGWWWGCWLVNGFASNVYVRMTMRSDPGVVEGGVWVGVTAVIFEIAAAVMVVRIVGQVRDWQTRAASPRPEIIHGTCTACGYDLRGAPGPACPGCGQRLPEPPLVAPRS